MVKKRDTNNGIAAHPLTNNTKWIGIKASVRVFHACMLVQSPWNIKYFIYIIGTNYVYVVFHWPRIVYFMHFTTQVL